MDNLQHFLNSGSKWLQSNKDLLQIYQELKDKAIQSIENQNSQAAEEEYSEFIFSIVLSHLKKKISAEKLFQLFKQIKEKRGIDELKELYEMLWLVGVFLDGLNKQIDEKEYQEMQSIFSSFLKNIGEGPEHLTDEVTLIDSFSEPQIKSLAYFDEKQYNQKRRKWNTKIYFFQTKYNLFSQQNEGYSKLLAMLLSVGEKFNATHVYEGVLDLIGYFDLDPDRVVECILDFYIFKPHAQSYQAILSHFNSKSITHFMGKKFEMFAALPEKSNNIHFKNAILVTAQLIKCQIIQIPSILPYLLPADKEFQEKAQETMKNAAKFYSESYSAQIIISDDEVKKIKEEEEKQTNLTSSFIDNQKLWLLDGLVKVNSWVYFNELFSIYYSCIDLKMHQSLLDSLLILFEWAIDIVYQKISPSSFIKKKHFQNPYSKYFELSLQNQELVQPQNIVGCMDIINKMLRIVKSYVGCNPLLYSKVLRIFRFIKNYNKRSKYSAHHIQTELDSEMIDENELVQLQNLVQELLGKYMLPALNIFECNPGAVNEFWNLFKEYDYKIRMKIYMECHLEHIYSSIFVLIKQGRAIREIKDIFNKFNQENKKQYSKKIVKIANNNPFVIQIFIMRRILQPNYDNLIPDIIGSFQYGTALSQDIFIYLILQYIYDKKDKPNSNSFDKKFDEKNGMTTWFKLSSLFISNFYKKFHNADMIPILMYLLNSFQVSKKKNTTKPHFNVAIDLYIFKDLISKMSGFSLPNTLSENQLQALAGGINLQIQSLQLTEDVRKCKKSQKALEAFFWQKSSNIKDFGIVNAPEDCCLAYYFLLLLGQEKAKFYDNYNYLELKTMESFSDMVTDSLNLLIFFLRFQQDYSQYASLMGPKALRELVLNYKIPIEIAFQITRPGFKPLSILTKQEEQEIFTEIQQVYDSIKYPDRLIVRPNTDDMEEEDEEDQQSKDQKNLIAKYEDTCHKKMWTQIKPQLYSIFWLLSLENISVNKEGYKFQIEALKKNIQEKQSDKNKKDKEKKELKDLESIVKKLDDEEQKQSKLIAKYETYLQSIKEDIALPKIREQIEGVISELCTSCILPRLLIDQSEALYCSRFLLLLFRINQSNLNDSVRSIRQAVTKILPFLQNATEKEAINISYFVNDIFKPFSNYLEGPEKLQESLKTHIHSQIINEKYSYDKYSNYIHSNIIDEVFKIAQQITKNESQVRNILILLNQIKEIFPKTRQQGQECKKLMEQLLEKYPKEQYKSVGTKIDVYYKLVTNLKNLPEAPVKSNDRDKKQSNQQRSVERPVRKENKEKDKDKDKDKSRERSSDRNKDKKEDRYKKDQKR
ncbi:hypothetical protein ABPG74_008479 [Tetrahymena malaccensis]